MLKTISIYFIIIFSSIVIFISCSDNTPTKPVDLVQLSGQVYQESNGLIRSLSGVEIAIGSYSTISDSIGFYKVDIPKGNYELICIQNRYDTTFIENLEINSNRVKVIKLNDKSFSISGIVSDTLGGRFTGAIIKLLHLKDTSDINGVFSFDSIPPGEWVLNCNYLDYFNYGDTVEIENSDIEHNLSLIRNSYQVSGIVSHPIDGLLCGIEIVLDDTLYDTTNSLGEYQFANIYSGEHQLQTHSSIYIYEIYNFTLGFSDLQKDLILGKSLIKRIFLEQDSYVVTRTYKPYDGIAVTSGEDVNYGASEYLDLTFRHTYDFGMRGEFIDHEASRVFVKIPTYETTNIDSVQLILSCGFSSSLKTIIISTILSDWDESTITWANQPIVDTDFIALTPLIDENSRWIIDITDKLNTFSTSYGIRFKYQYEECYFMCESWLLFASSEFDEAEKRPYILIYRTE